MQSWHPLVVHFPIALLLTAAVLDVLALAMRRPSIHRIATWNLSLGTLAAIVTAGSGLLAARVARHSFEIWKVMERHERLAYVTIGLGCAALGWRWITRHWPDRPRYWIATALTLAAAGSVAAGAHLGGRLVYELGVGGTFGIIGIIGDSH